MMIMLVLAAQQRDQSTTVSKFGNYAIRRCRHDPCPTHLNTTLLQVRVDKKFRLRGLGRALVHSEEDVARVYWTIDNTAVVQFDLSKGYKEVNGVRWNPFWAGPAADIGYYVKELS
eukprot:scaffold5532_cov180-Amphora_coffeaeformis.AAC.1